MTEQQRRESFRLYFKGHFLETLGSIIMVVGLILMIQPILGVIVLILGGVIGYQGRKKVPKDHEVDQLFAEEFEFINARAVQKYGIQLEDIRVKGIVVAGIPDLCSLVSSQTELKFKKGRDKVLRLTPIGILSVSLTENQILAYQCNWDLLTGNPLNEKVHEYFLRDIVSIKTETVSMTYELKRHGTIQSNLAEVLKLTSTGGDGFSFLINDPVLIKKWGAGVFMSSRAEEAMQRIRVAVREKKAA